MPPGRDSSGPSAGVLSLFNLRQPKPSHPGEPDNEKLEKRRATNRSSQRKARDRNQALIKTLQVENERLKRAVGKKCAYLTFSPTDEGLTNTNRSTADSISG